MVKQFFTVRARRDDGSITEGKSLEANCAKLTSKFQRLLNGVEKGTSRASYYTKSRIKKAARDANRWKMLISDSLKLQRQKKGKVKSLPNPLPAPGNNDLGNLVFTSTLGTLKFIMWFSNFLDWSLAPAETGPQLSSEQLDAAADNYAQGTWFLLYFDVVL